MTSIGNGGNIGRTLFGGYSLNAQPDTARILKQIFEGSSDGIIFADGEGKIRLWNSGAEQIFGYTESEALGSSLDLIVPERFRERHWEGYRRVMETGETQYGDRLLSVPGVGRDGSRISLEFTVCLIKTEGGAVDGVAAIVRDGTEGWQRERGLKQRVAELEQKLEEAGRPL